MEKHLPLTAIIFEGIVVSVATVMFIRVGGLAQILLPSALFVILLTIILGKDYRLVTVRYLAALTLAFYSAGNIQEFRIIGGLIVVIIILEVGVFFANLSFESLKNSISPTILNGGFAFLGILIAFVYRIKSCPPLFPGHELPSNFISVVSPVCIPAFQKYVGMHGDIFSSPDGWVPLLSTRFAIDFLLWFPVLSGALAALAETIRQGGGCNPIGWLLSYLKTTFLGGLASTLISTVIMVVLFPIVGLNQNFLYEYFGKATTGAELLVITEYWLIALIMLFIYLFYISLIYGWASSVGTK